jgi:hypothetical protein
VRFAGGSTVRVTTVRVTAVRAIGACVASAFGALAFVLVPGVLAPGVADAATPPVLLSGSTTAKLTQVSVRDWTTTVYLDTAALCQGTPAFNLVTATPDSDSRDWKPYYPNQLRCDAEVSHPVTEVELTFTPTPALSAVPQSATLTVTPAQSQLLASDPPLQLPLTIRRTVSAWQYLWIPAIFGGALTLLFLALVVTFGVPGDRNEPRNHWGWKFLNTPLFAATAWSFGDSWATSVTPLTALVGGLLTASGTVAGLVPGVDLGRFGLLMAVVGGITVLAPLLFGALNSLFPLRYTGPQDPSMEGDNSANQPNHAPPAHSSPNTNPPNQNPPNQNPPDQNPPNQNPPDHNPPDHNPQSNGNLPVPGEVAEARLWVMMFASCLTVFAVGAELGIVGWVLGHDLVVASPLIRWCAPVAAMLTGLLFLGYGVHSIVTLAGQPNGRPKRSAKAHSFML